ncbi:MAG TPA: DinB family protein [Candidatus Acidoferrales bacterium]|nr:DinB family protein [Candidatus Acidoferrales bacterium]
MKYISKLNEQKEILDALFDKKEIYNKRYRKGGWTGKEVLIHLKDAETMFYERLRRTISEANPVLWYFEEDNWQKNLEYMKQDMSLAKNLFKLTRDSIIELIKMHLDKYDSKKAVHSRYGTMNVKELIERMIKHTDNHIRQLKRIKHSP